MLKRKLYLIPLTILCIVFIISIFRVSTTNLIFTNEHYLGLLALIICVVATLRNKLVGVFLTGITLVLGLFNVIAFTANILYFSFGFSIGIFKSGEIEIQLFSLFVLMIFLIFNLKNVILLFRNRNKNESSGSVEG